MSENQLSPLHTNPVPSQPADPVDLQIQQESRTDPTESQNGIERRQILSPVSPHPVHVQESPVLKNQMELANNFTDAHPPTNSSGAGPSSAAVVSPDLSSLQSLIQQHQQQTQQQQQQNLQHGQLSSTIQSAPQHQQQPSQSEATTYASSSLPAAAPFPAMDNSTASSSFSHAGNGEVPAGNGSFESSASSASSIGTAPSKPTNIYTNGPLPPPPASSTTTTTTTLPNNMSSSNVDLQALLTKLSSPTTPTVPQQLHSAPQSPPLPNGAPVVAPSSSAPPPSVKTPLPQSPVQKTRTSSNPPPAPTNHPLPPVPVVSSSLPGQPPAGYPSSLPPPPNFAQHKQQQAASVTEEEDEEDVRPFTVDEEEAFSQFLTDERDYVSHGQWDRFPPGSRLFIGAHPPVLPPLIDMLPTWLALPFALTYIPAWNDPVA
jgi:nuclear polyadenylated RNA-binding protein 3